MNALARFSDYCCGGSGLDEEGKYLLARPKSRNFSTFSIDSKSPGTPRINRCNRWVLWAQVSKRKRRFSGLYFLHGNEDL